MTINEAAQGFLSGWLLPEAMPEALDRLAAAAEGDSAVLLYSRDDVVLNVIGSRSLAGALRDYTAGDRPRDTRTARVNPTIDEGFRIDQDDFTAAAIARDPFYQEFLRPRGIGWHACALLGETPQGDRIHLGIKRAIAHGPFGHEALAPLEAHLEVLRAAVQFTQLAAPTLGALIGGLPGLGRRSLLGFSRFGEAFDISRLPEDRSVIAVRGGAVSCANRRDQPALDEALDRVRRQADQASAMLTGLDGRRWAFRIRRWTGNAFGPIVYAAVVSPLDGFEEPSDVTLQMVRDLFRLSQAEARVATMVGQGLSVPEVAARLNLRSGTVRNQLKSVFQKTGVKRQSELSHLLSRL